MEYETWLWANVRVWPKDPMLPLNSSGDYSNVAFAQDGPPVARGGNIPECGTSLRILPWGVPWTNPIPDYWQRCPSCLSRHPVPEPADRLSE